MNTYYKVFKGNKHELLKDKKATILFEVRRFKLLQFQ